jgi:putative membrane protein
MKRLLITSTSLLALCLALPAAAEGTSSTSPAGGMDASGATSGSTEGGAQSRAGVVSRQDRKFVEQAAEGGMAEVQLGQLAAQRAQDPAVRDFANRMVSDHTPANQRLMTIAATAGITPPDKLDFMHRHSMKKLGKADAKDFDMDYIESQVKDHEKMAELMEDEIKDGQNPELKQFATDMLPRIREHHQMAQRLEEQLKQQEEQREQQKDQQKEQQKSQ